MKFQKVIYIDPAEMFDLLNKRIDYIDFLERSSERKNGQDCVKCLVTIDAIIMATDLIDKD